MFRRRRACQLGRGKSSRGLPQRLSTPIAGSHGHVEGQTNGRGEPLVPPPVDSKMTCMAARPRERLARLRLGVFETCLSSNHFLLPHYSPWW